MRPLGITTPLEAQGVLQPIPESGAELIYEAPDISGEVNFVIEGIDSEGNALEGISGTFRAREPTSTSFLPIDIAGLRMDVASHPEGIYGTPAFIQALESAADRFYESLPSDSLAELESEGASLPWGGLFDVNHDWLNPHCGHRNGKTIDVSMSTLNEKEKQLLKSAILKSSLGFYYIPESPSNPSANHWHVEFKN